MNFTKIIAAAVRAASNLKIPLETAPCSRYKMAEFTGAHRARGSRS
jgi:hypothetical protein